MVAIVCRGCEFSVGQARVERAGRDRRAPSPGAGPHRHRGCPDDPHPCRIAAATKLKQDTRARVG
eukprot:196878-Hanusia_phi.AAC.4